MPVAGAAAAEQTGILPFWRESLCLSAVLGKDRAVSVCTASLISGVPVDSPPDSEESSAKRKAQTENFGFDRGSVVDRTAVKGYHRERDFRRRAEGCLQDG